MLNRTYNSSLKIGCHLSSDSLFSPTRSKLFLESGIKPYVDYSDAKRSNAPIGILQNVLELICLRAIVFLLKSLKIIMCSVLISNFKVF